MSSAYGRAPYKFFHYPTLQPFPYHKYVLYKSDDNGQLFLSPSSTSNHLDCCPFTRTPASTSLYSPSHKLTTLLHHTSSFSSTTLPSKLHVSYALLTSIKPSQVLLFFLSSAHIHPSRSQSGWHTSAFPWILSCASINMLSSTCSPSRAVKILARTLATQLCSAIPLQLRAITGSPLLTNRTTKPLFYSFG